MTEIAGRAHHALGRMRAGDLEPQPRVWRHGRISFMGLPQPDDLTSLVLRTDFSDDAGWQTLQSVIDSQGEYSNATYVSDLAYAGVTVRALVEADAAAPEDDQLMYLFLADAVTMTDAESPLLAVDLFDEPGRTFRGFGGV